MPILGIDYGRRKVGIAIAEESLAEPYMVIRYESIENLLLQIGNLLRGNKIEKIVVGVSEGLSKKESQQFGKLVGEKLKIPVVFFDETLTTQEANELAIKAGLKRKKRKYMEDAYSACLILQNYLDSEYS